MPGPWWSKSDEEKLVRLWRSGTSDLSANFPERSVNSIRLKAFGMGLGRRIAFPGRVVPAAKRKQAAAMRRKGVTFKEIAHHFGLRSGSSIRGWLDPKYAKARKDAARDRRKSIPKSPVHVVSQASVERTAAVLATLIPPDTRDLTAKLCGDPLPGRRAIDQKREMQPHPLEVPFQ